jgi:hypothetical protein
MKWPVKLSQYDRLDLTLVPSTARIVVEMDQACIFASWKAVANYMRANPEMVKGAHECVCKIIETRPDEEEIHG